MSASQDEIPPPPPPPPSSPQTPTQQTPHTVSTIKLQVAMISMRMKKFYKKTGRKLQFDAKEPVECYNCQRHFARECRIKGLSRESQDNRRRDAWNSGT
ncbi:hypothetical protein Tco_0330191, partial [Tanacetum coccineum]